MKAAEIKSCLIGKMHRRVQFKMICGIMYINKINLQWKAIAKEIEKEQDYVNINIGPVKNFIIWQLGKEINNEWNDSTNSAEMRE